MKRIKDMVLIFIISLLGSYLFVGGFRNIFVGYKWSVDATIWDKLREFYIRMFPYNIMPSIYIAVAITTIVMFINRKKYRKT